MKATLWTFALAVLLAIPAAMDGKPDAAARAVLTAGLFLFGRDVWSAGRIQPASGQLALAHWATHLLHLTLFLFAFLTIRLWDGSDAHGIEIVQQALHWYVFALVIFGAILFWQRSSLYSDELSPDFDTTKPATATLLGRIVYFGWPIAATALITLNLLFTPQGGWASIFPLFQMAFLPFLVPLYPIAGTLRTTWIDRLPRSFGLVLLFVALIFQ